MKLMKPAVLVVLVTLSGCIELDFFLFDSVEVDSLEDDYHGLPLFVGDEPPGWIEESVVEREIYLRVPSGELIDKDQLEGERDYLHGAFLHAPAGCQPEECPLAGEQLTFIYQHGNSGQMYRYWFRAVALWSMGANVFIYTYRNYGLSRGSGDTSRSSVLEDARTAMKYLRTRPDVDQSKIIAYGYSMGGIPTSYLVGRSEHKGRFKAAVLESALDSPASSVNLSTGTEFPDGFFLDEDLFDGPRFIEGASIPILHMHGREDSRVLPVQGERYFKVLEDRDDYTHFLGKTKKEHEDWIAGAAHRNVPIASFQGEDNLGDYWGHDDNPSHCCVHPLEYEDPVHGAFLDAIGETTGEEMYRDSERYKRLVCDWVLSLNP